MRNGSWILALAVAGVCGGWVSSARATSTLIESWENTADGWTIGGDQSANYSIAGFSTTTGVTNGSYSMIVTGTAAPNYGQLLDSPSTMALTTLLGSSSSVSIDVDTPSGSFGYYQQWDLVINNADTGYTSIDGYSYAESPSIGNESTLVFPLPTSITSVLATSSNPTQIVFQVGGGYTAGNQTMYLDNVEAIGASSTVTFSSTTANWVNNGSGNWETAANWSSNPSIPGAAGSNITFDNNGGAITGNPMVTLSQNAAATFITFGNTNGGPTPNYTINSGAPGVSLAVSSEIDADSGSHSINLPVATASGNFYFDILSGASLTIPNFSDSSYSSITKLDTGTLTLGASLHCSIFVDGTLTFTDGNSGGWLYGITAYSDGVVNLGKNSWNTNSISGDSNGGGVINIPAGGTLYTVEYPATAGAPSTDFYSGTISGGGNLVVGEGASATDTTQIIYGNTLVLYGTNSGFNGTVTVGSSFPAGGPMTAPAAFTLAVGSASNLGDGSATNQVVLDGGILQAIGSFVGTQNVVVTANGGTIDTDGPPAGDNTQPPIPGGCAVTLGAVSSTANGILTKINAGELTVAKITGVSLVVNGGTVQLAPNGTSAGASSLNALTFALGSNNVPQGSLDITNNKVTIAAPSGSDPITTIVGYLQTGYDAGRWDGAGIQSSSVANEPGTSIGYADGNTDSGTSAAPGTIVVMDTWLGDLNLDGSVTNADLATLTANLGKSGDWSHGDLNYDGKINADDLSLFMLGAADYKAAGSIPVPEPASLGMLILAAGLPMRLRRR